MPTISFEEVVNFIKKMAAMYVYAAEEWEYEYLESETLQKIIEFAADEQDVAFETFSKKLFNAPEDDSEPDFYSLALAEIMRRHYDQKLLSEKTSQLYTLYIEEFWGEKQPPSKDLFRNPIPTGLAELDKIIGGWLNNDLIILGGSPGSGKTGMMLSFARKAARRGNAVCIFTLGQSSQSLVGRMLFSDSDAPAASTCMWSFSRIDMRNLLAAIEDFTRLLIYFDDNPEATMDYITEKSRCMHLEGRCHMIIIDCQQMIKFGSDKSNLSGREKVEYVSKQAKQIAMDLNIPVILLSNLGRWVDERLPFLPPRITDLPWAKSLEPYADIILLVHRHAFHGTLSNIEGNSTRKKCEIIIAKNRGKELGRIRFKHNKGMSKIEDAD